MLDWTDKTYRWLVGGMGRDHRHSDISIPEEVKAGIARYLAHYNLPYGAFDFSVDRDGYWWFLECNPNGQWGFIAEATGAPIASAIADVLLGECLP
jgi:hypothetical protein